VIKLLPCPFCGDDNAYFTHSAYGPPQSNDKQKWVVNCQRCTVSTSVPMHAKEFAAEQWNKRIPKPPGPRLIKTGRSIMIEIGIVLFWIMLFSPIVYNLFARWEWL